MTIERITTNEPILNLADISSYTTESGNPITSLSDGTIISCTVIARGIGDDAIWGTMDDVEISHITQDVVIETITTERRAADVFETDTAEFGVPSILNLTLSTPVAGQSVTAMATIEYTDTDGDGRALDDMINDGWTVTWEWNNILDGRGPILTTSAEETERQAAPPSQPEITSTPTISQPYSPPPTPPTAPPPSTPPTPPPPPSTGGGGGGYGY